VFQRYTETARKAIFFARYEVSHLGGKHIETEHLLLGVLRSDSDLALRVLKEPVAVESIRKRIEDQSSRPEKSVASVDLPLSNESKRVLAHGADEANRLKHERIGAEHLLMGMLREKNCVAAKILGEAGVTLATVRQEVTRSMPESALGKADASPAPSAQPPPDFRDLTEEARNGTLGPLIGRESELESVMRILSRRTRNNAVLVGESGVGKSTIVHGLAQRIADGIAPANLAHRTILAIDASALIDARLDSEPSEFRLPENSIIYVRGLFDLAGKGSAWSSVEALHVLEPHLAAGRVHCIATGTPFGLRLTLERAERLASHFEVVSVLPPKEDEAIRILQGVKSQYEKFHGVVIGDEALEAAVSASRWFLRHRQLPDRAIDLIDEAAARVKLRRESHPPEIAEIERRIRLIVRQMESAIANREFTKAKSYSEEEKQERAKLERQRGDQSTDLNVPTNVVTAEDVLETVATRANILVSALQSRLQDKDVERLDLVAKELIKQLPAGGERWVDSLTAYLADCSVEEMERLLSAIRAAKARIDS
jgi:ATP-dependent Clp protease ATP-binding subunit ClpC